MRLAEFIETNVEAILAESEAFARNIWPEEATNMSVDPTELRDHAHDILVATVEDMRSPQSSEQKSAKSKGELDRGQSSARLDKASSWHGRGRVGSGFELWAVPAEYRALRASVLRLWRESGPASDPHDIDDVTRFNESIDQSLAEAIRSYAEQAEEDRALLLDNQQRARSEAENANRAKDMFLATLSHELRTPLTAILGWIEILKVSSSRETILVEGLEVIERNARAQVTLIEDMLDVSRIVSGKLRLEIQDCDLIGVIRAGMDVVRPTALARGITLDSRLDESARRVSCDRARMEQVVWNLLSNAIKFTNTGGTVRVTLDREGAGLALRVSDNGQGISPELLPFVFERFRQADSSSSRAYGGLGLGLSIVKHLVEMHGGTVEVHSEGKDRGATFTVRLPANVERAAQPTREERAQIDHESSATWNGGELQTQLHGLHVLVVDDVADARRILSKALQAAGATVSTAASAAEALTVLRDARQAEPDLLVSDLGLPGQDGYALVREVRRLGYDAEKLPAVAVSAFTRREDAQQATAAGFQLHLPKPVNLHELTSVIARLGRKRR